MSISISSSIITEVFDIILNNNKNWNHSFVYILFVPIVNCKIITKKNNFINAVKENQYSCKQNTRLMTF